MRSRSVSPRSGDELCSVNSVHSQPCFPTQRWGQHLDPTVQKAPGGLRSDSQGNVSSSAQTMLNAPSPCASAVRRLASSHARLGLGYGLAKQAGPPACPSPTASSSDWVRLNVGGRTFVTTLSTLCADPDSVLAQLFGPLRARLLAERAASTGESARECAGAPREAARSVLSTGVCPAYDEAGGGGEQLNPQPEEEPLLPLDLDPQDGILLDLDPDYFAPVLNYLRHCVLMVPPQLSPKGLLAVARYLNVRGMVRQLLPVRQPRQLIFSWGSGTNGELGTQLLEDSEVPRLVRVAPFGVRVKHVALGANYSCVLTEEGSIYTFGNGDWGQLGLVGAMNLDTHLSDKSSVVLVPRRIPLFEQHRAVHLSAGYAFAIAVVEGYHVYFWGNNNHGQSGLGPDYFTLGFKKIDEPKLVESLEGKRVVEVGCGSFFTIARTEDGRLYSWGLIECLGLGSPDAVKQRYANTPILGESMSNEKRAVVLTPQEVRIDTAHPIVRLHAGQWHSGAINAAGELFTWGVGYQGRLGHGTREPAYVPTRVRGALEGHRVVEVACGSFHTVARTDRGAVFCWGDNASGQCGMSPANMEAVVSPYQVVRLEYVAGGVARAVSCGRQHTLVVMQGPQPGCVQRCCRFEASRGRSRPLHAQVYTFGDTLRSGAGGGGVFNGNVATGGPTRFPFRTSGTLPTATPTASSLPLRPAGVRGQVVFNNNNNNNNNNSNNSNPTGSNNNISINNNNNTSGGRANTVVVDYPNSTTAPVSFFGPPHREYSPYQLVPGLEQMDVRGIVSGLYHSFVFAEELEPAEGSLFPDRAARNGCSMQDLEDA